MRNFPTRVCLLAYIAMGAACAVSDAHYKKPDGTEVSVLACHIWDDEHWEVSLEPQHATATVSSKDTTAGGATVVPAAMNLAGKALDKLPNAAPATVATP